LLAANRAHATLVLDITRDIIIAVARLVVVDGSGRFALSTARALARSRSDLTQPE